MKRLMKFALLALATLALAAPITSIAKAGMSKAKSPMAQYMVISTHTPEQCVKALDDAAAVPGGLSKWSFGCMDGDHTGYLMCNATSAEAALRNVPEDERGAAKAIKLHRITAAELKGIHEHMSAK